MSEDSERDQVPIGILFIEDNIEIQEATRLIFELHWPEAEIILASEGAEGLDLMKSESPDLVILDLGLPDMDGMKVLRDIRSFSEVPVVVLTVRGEEMDKIRGLELGADDYVIKPFTHQELLARVKRVLYPHQPVLGIKVERALDRPGTNVDLELGVVYKDGAAVRLSNTETILLKYLAANSGRSMGDDEILTEIWGEDYVDSSEYLDAYIHSLRQKLENDPENPKIIVQDENGYRFVKESIQSI